jgi:hypothetical protein
MAPPAFFPLPWYSGGGLGWGGGRTTNKSWTPKKPKVDQCRDVIEAKFAGELGVGTYESGLWKDWLIDQILLREAEAVIGSLPNSTSDEAPASAVSQAGKR